MPLSLRSRPCLALALLSACGPANPGQSEASDTGATDTTDTDNAPTEATPTEPTGGPQPEECGASRRKEAPPRPDPPTSSTSS